MSRTWPRASFAVPCAVCGTQFQPIIYRDGSLSKTCCRRCGSTFAHEANRTHGLTDSPEYRAWHCMKQRCHNPTDAAYPLYGGRGIEVCDRWKNSFELFLADMGPRPTPDHTLERTDNELGYGPGNCRWATQMEQCRNTRHNHTVTWDGKTFCLTDWAIHLGIKKTTLGMRLRSGWSVERALTTPSRPYQKL